MQDLLIFFIALFLTIKGAQWLLSSAISFSRLFGIPEAVIGATIVSIATTMPETLVSSFSSFLGHAGLGWGSLLGTPLVNLGLIGGMVLLLGHPKSIEAHLGQRRAINLIFLGLTLLIFVLGLLFRSLGKGAGVVLLGFSVFYFLFEIYSGFKKGNLSRLSREKVVHRGEILLLKFGAGCFLLLAGTRFLSSSAISLVEKMGLPEVFVGLTLVAIGTSLPEFITAIEAILRKEEEISVGNLMGASIIVLSFSLGLLTFFGSVEVTSRHLTVELPALTVFAFIVFLNSLTKKKEKLFGVVLIFSYIFYLGSLFW